MAKETTKSGGGTDRVCMRRRSRTLPWGRSAPRSSLGGVVVAPSLHSRSVNTDLIKTSRSSTPLTCAGNGGGSSFNGAFLPECVSDQCFRSTAGANAVLSLPLSMEICAHPVHGHRASERCSPRRHVVGRPGTPRRRWWPQQQQHNEKRFSENRARIWTAIEVRLRPHCADGRLRVTDGGGGGGGGGPIRRRHVLIACFAIQDVGGGGRR